MSVEADLADPAYLAALADLAGWLVMLSLHAPVRPIRRHGDSGKLLLGASSGSGSISCESEARLRLLAPFQPPSLRAANFALSAPVF